MYAKLPLTIATLLAVVSFQAAAVSGCPAHGNDDLRSQLPGAVRRQLSSSVGVESLTQENLSPPHQHLLAAIVLPSWYFLPDYCTGPRQNADAPRFLHVWRKTNGKWIAVGSGNRFIWPIATAGKADVSVAGQVDGFVLSQSSAPIRSIVHDDFVFRFDYKVLRLRLVRRTSGDLYSPMGSGGSGDEMTAQYEQALEEFGSVSEQEGYEAEADFLTGNGSVTEYTFAKPEKKRTVRVPTEPIYIEHMTEKNLRELRSFR